ncbi:MAG: tetratricopeptide repeat protein, partial [Anaerolineae bacterium]|nr:tetratricopeptide repeat protein [Anaerolineae bacterium]
ELEDIKRRARFYVPEVDKLEVLTSTIPGEILNTRDPILLFCDPAVVPDIVLSQRHRVFNVDYRRNPTDGWDWIYLARYLDVPPPDWLTNSKRKFVHYVEQLRLERMEKTYIFGTGPTLEKAITRDWGDGYRVVCNTIVRDVELWKHIAPHFIVAADAIYHFGHTAFAYAFRSDLAKRLREGGTYFVYPVDFDVIVRRELGEFAEWLVPVPVNGAIRRLDIDMTTEFCFPGLGNVLALALLPVACTLSKNIYLWGFDGRAPNDRLFWSNSPKHSYPELLSELQKAHPKFFEHYVPQNDPEKYVRQVHGDELDALMTQAEQRGFSFTMMHKTWTPTLRKRLAVHEDVTPLLKMAEEAFAQGDLDTAERHYLDALMTEPYHAEILAALGDLEYRRERYEDSLQWFIRATRNDSSCVPAWAGLAKIADLFGNTEVAYKALIKLSELAPNHSVFVELGPQYLK